MKNKINVVALTTLTLIGFAIASNAAIALQPSSFSESISYPTDM